MAGTAKTTYLANKFLNLVARNTAYTPPATAYLALFTSDPTETGSLAGEVTGGSYARQAITFGSVASASSISSTANITFATLPAAVITHVGICDASTAGNILYYKALTTPATVAAGDSYLVPASSLTIIED